MNVQREAELLQHVPTLASLAEAEAFRAGIIATETMGAGLYAALLARIDYLAKKERRK